MSGLAASGSSESDPNFYTNRSLASWLTDLIVEGYAVFKKTTVFLGSVLFKNQVQFVDKVFMKGTVEFNKNTAGVGIISKYTDAVQIQFETPYEQAPIVSISMVEKSATDSAMFMEEGKNAVVTDVKPTGFTIHLPQQALRDYEYNWVAIYVKDPSVTKSSTTLSDVLGEASMSAGIIPSVSPTVTPTPTTILTPTPSVATDSASL
jgi:hypothetical protein